MGYDIFWSFIIFVILAGAVMMLGVSKGSIDEEKSNENNNEHR